MAAVRASVLDTVGQRLLHECGTPDRSRPGLAKAARLKKKADPLEPSPPLTPAPSGSVPPTQPSRFRQPPGGGGSRARWGGTPGALRRVGGNAGPSVWRTRHGPPRSGRGSPRSPRCGPRPPPSMLAWRAHLFTASRPGESLVWGIPAPCPLAPAHATSIPLQSSPSASGSTAWIGRPSRRPGPLNRAGLFETRPRPPNHPRPGLHGDQRSAVPPPTIHVQFSRAENSGARSPGSTVAVRLVRPGSRTARLWGVLPAALAPVPSTITGRLSAPDRRGDGVGRAPARRSPPPAPTAPWHDQQESARRRGRPTRNQKKTPNPKKNPPSGR